MKITKICNTISQAKRIVSESTPVRAYRLHQYNNGSFTNDFSCFDWLDCFRPVSFGKAILKLVTKLS